MKTINGCFKKAALFAFAALLGSSAIGEELTLTGETKTLDDVLTVTGIKFTGSTSSSIIAPLSAANNIYEVPPVPSSEFSDIYGVSLLSPDGTQPGTIDASGSEDVGGKIATGLSDLVFDTTNECVSGTCEYSLTNTLPSYSTKKSVVYWKNRTLANIKSVHAIFHYGAAENENIARTCFFTNNGTKATMQFQGRMSYECGDGRRRYLMGTCVQLTQSGSDILAKVTDGGYVNTIVSNLGECVDFKVCPHSQQYYPIRCLLAGEADTNGGKGIEVKTAGFSTVCESTYELNSGGEAVTYWNNLKLDDIVGMKAETKAASKWISANGYFMNRIDDATLQVTFQRYAGSYEECDGVITNTVGNDYTASTTVEFKQVGSSVTARFVSAGYRRMHVEAKGGQHPGVGTLPISTSLLTSGAYPARNITVFVKPKVDLGGPVDVAGGLRLSGGGTLKISAPAAGFSPITGNGSVHYFSDRTWVPPLSNTVYGVTANSYDGRTIFDGGYHYINAKGVIPSGGAAILTNQAMLVVKQILSSVGQLDVYPGCTLLIDVARCFSSNPIRLYGSILHLNQQLNYFNNITLCDGASITVSDTFKIPNKDVMDGFRFGNEPRFPWIYSIGSGTNRIDSTIWMYRPKGGTGFNTFFAAADLLLSGRIGKSRNDGGYEGSLVKKRGVGKLILAPTCFNGDDSYANTVRVEVVEGTLRNESPNALRTVNSVELHCGATYEAVSQAQSIGLLVVDAKQSWQSDGATLKFEDGGSLSLPENGLSIAEGAKLILDGDVGETSFRVGTSASLSPDILSRIRIRCNGRLRRVRQESDGSIVGPTGCIMILR